MAKNNIDRFLTGDEMAIIKAGINFLEGYTEKQRKIQAKKARAEKLTKKVPDSKITQKQEDSTLWAPTSKTAVGRHVYRVTDLPEVFVMKVEVEHESKGGKPITDEKTATNDLTTWMRVMSRGLRETALSELLQVRFPAIKNVAVINTRAGHLVDHIIVFSGGLPERAMKSVQHSLSEKEFLCKVTMKSSRKGSSNAKVKTQTNTLTNATGNIPSAASAEHTSNPTSTSMQNGDVTNGEDETTEARVRCTITGFSKFTDLDQDNSLYRKCITALIRSRASLTPDIVQPNGKASTALLGPTFVSHRSFFFDVPDGAGHAFTQINPRLSGCESRAGEKDDKTMEFRLRVRAALSYNPTQKAIQLEYDLVAGLPHKRHLKAASGTFSNASLLDIVYSIVRDRLTEQNVSHHIQFLAQTLRGLQVKRNYSPPDSWSADRKENFSKPFTVEQLRFDGEKTEMKKQDSPVEANVQSPYDFLAEKYGLDPKHRYLPLIGSNIKGSVSWFPMEHLAICPNQHIVGSDALLPALKSQVKKHSGSIQTLLDRASKEIWDTINKKQILPTGTKETRPLFAQERLEKNWYDTLTLALA
ncbi:hypothetical protein N0V90_008510 [Kalmusia sp. IMI 367209]|nr:hypothetical protein N0V90_008510 [Kalmusia sp. IMI 367209]